MNNHQSESASNFQSSRLKSNQTLQYQHSRAHIKRKKQTQQSQFIQADDNLKMINQSMVQLQDPKFISDQLDQFQVRLLSQSSNNNGFCKKTRQASLMLSNAQGYRKYKKQIKAQQNKTIEVQKQQTKPNKQDQIKNNIDQRKEQQQVIQNKIQKMQQQFIQTKRPQSTESLSYSVDSRERMRAKLSQISKESKNNQINHVSNNTSGIQDNFGLGESLFPQLINKQSSNST